ncbi:DSD1 family PLP-dependent enzyme [Pusillimonas sp. TS35]|nr:DSD1 family PLP-dependent enzyme [Pusillimonas sp. TS35]
MENRKQDEENGAVACAALALAPIARVGDPITAIDTPALVLDMDAFEANVQTMQAWAARHGVALRPHAKAHRCPELSRRQLAAGAVGVCCQKVSEVIPFIAAGVQDIHVSNEVVGADKLALLTRLAGQARITVCVDHPDAARALSEALAQQGNTMGVLVEVDIGQRRCGLQTPEGLVALARLVQDLPQIHFAGIQAYQGGLQHIRGVESRRASWQDALARVRAYLAALEQAGIACPIVTGGGTGSAVFDVASGVFTEIQPGTYAFMDADYGAIGWTDALSFRNSLFLLATVMSLPSEDRAVVDAGLKSTTAESGMPGIAGRPGVRCVAVNDEHSMLQIDEGAQGPALGDKIRLIPGHCDPTFNLHDSVVAVRNGRVEAVWPISARGMSR